MTDLKCPNCGSDRRIIAGRKGDASRFSSSVIRRDGKGYRNGNMHYTCLKCGFNYSNHPMVKQ